MFGFSKFPKSRKLGTRRLAYEQLERREMLSGGGRDGTIYPDCDAYVDSGTLYIVGSNWRDDHVLVQQPSSSSFWVTFDGYDRRDFEGVQVDKIHFSGGGGSDTFINFTALPCTAFGGLGNDRLYGGSGCDTLYGEAGDDLLCGDNPDWLALGGHRGSNDVLRGGADNDTYLFNTDYFLGSDSIDESGQTSVFDRLDFSYTAHTQVFLDLGANGGSFCIVNDNLTLTFALAWEPNLHFLTNGIENVIGGARNDWLTGNALDNILVGGPGCDHLDGAAGDDWLIGGWGGGFLGGEAGFASYIDGGDWLYAGPGDDLMIGCEGDDTYVFDLDLNVGREELWERPQDGIDTLDFSPTTQCGVDIDLSYVYEQYPDWGAGGYPLTLLLVNPLQPPPDHLLDPNYFLSWDSFENVIGTPLRDRITGNKLDNVLIGGDGDDLLAGLEGNDTLFGCAGLNELWGNNSHLWPEYPDDDKLYGGPEKDILHGGRGDDWLYGEGGNDILEGEEGNDWLFGGSGMDTFKGGPGADHIRAIDLFWGDCDSIWFDTQDDVQMDSNDGYMYTAVISFPIRPIRSRRAGNALGRQATISADRHLPLDAGVVPLPRQSRVDLRTEGTLTRSTDRCSGDLLHSTRAGCISR